MAEIGGAYLTKQASKLRGKTVAGICNSHGFWKDAPRCPQCAVAPPKKGATFLSHNWVKGWYEHIDHEPIYIESKEHLIRECEKRGQVAKAFMKRRSQGKGFVHSR